MSKAVLVIDMPERCHDCPFLDGDDAWLNDPPKMVHRSTREEISARDSLLRNISDENIKKAFDFK